MSTATQISVLGEVAAERERQNAKWGEQNHPDGTGLEWAHEADAARVACQVAHELGRCTWRHILQEEVAEALAESDPEPLRAELVQVAAVAISWVEALDRRSS